MISATSLRVQLVNIEVNTVCQMLMSIALLTRSRCHCALAHVAETAHALLEEAEELQGVRTLHSCQGIFNGAAHQLCLEPCKHPEPLARPR